MNAFRAKDDPEKPCIGEWTIASLTNDDQVHGRDDKHALVARSDSGDKIARCLPAKTDVVPIFSLPRDIQHFFDIDLAGAVIGRPIQPESHTKYWVSMTAVEQLVQHPARHDLPVTILSL